ncbi:amidase family protein [Aestuariivivens sediminis]|uniref:amidase family protein n=1 Tax=Aestuariivivens sediminis TaxID=2913557 RepID=UPI001F55BEA1|nr:amidase family protein [Aestuariivivens sediminis]
MKHHCLLIFAILLSGLLGCQKDQEPTPIDLNELTIQDIHKAFQEGKYNSQQLVKAYLERIERLDSNINSITAINLEALTIAKELDDEFQRTKFLRPLHGIPVIVKDNINTKGLKTTAGALALQNFMPENDAFIISKLVDAGAIILAKSNMAEWAFTPWGSFSSTNGETFNPYNTEFSPGGSSGGTGASIAANFGVIGLGTDTGNSIRGPSSHGSMVGIRPTMGLVSRSGIVPCNLSNDMAGPMCRTVEDATLVLEIIAGNDGEDPLTENSNNKIPVSYRQFLVEDGLKGSRIGILREIGNPDPDILNLFDKAIRDMNLMGAIIIDSVSIPNFFQLKENLFCVEFRSRLETFLRDYVKNDTVQTIEDIVRIGTKSNFTARRLENSANSSGAECLDAYSDQRRVDFRIAIESHMDELKLDVLVYPSWNIKPYRMDSIVEKYIGDNSSVISPHTGQPAITVPMGFMKEGLPSGIEFLGRMYSEPILIKLAYSYELGTKHRRMPNLDKAITKDKIN